MSEELNHLVNKNAQGRRPQFLNTKTEEHLLSMTMALMQELAVTRERLDTLERVLEAKGNLTTEELKSYRPDETAESERQEAQRRLIATVMRSIEQEKHALEDLAAPEVSQLHVVSDDEKVA
ncbi:MAG: hypothetical protein JJ850_01835 [Kordiimonadaceae bacterium]|nr:hypothetical protein [Kordiimonadaceae bacterium]MBO6567457.1 hypothetical protein [Kordiimonadaceae bacterium]MBO6963329.1 hypothetical protein [Kordiimonadaceae bacterium]